MAHELPARLSRAPLQVFAGTGRVVEHVAFAVDHHVRRREALQHLRLDRSAQGERPGGRLPAARPRGSAARAARTSSSGSCGRVDAMVAAPEDALLLVERREQIGVLRHVLRDAEEQEAAWPQRIVEDRNDLACRSASEVDQQVAAADQVDPGERRIAQDAVGREDAQVAHLLASAEKVPPSSMKKRCRRSGETPSKQRWPGSAPARATASAALVDVGAEDLHLGRHCAAWSMCSRSRMAIEYTSSPVAQPGTQTRTASSRAPALEQLRDDLLAPAPRRRRGRERTTVTPISRSRNSSVTSSGSRRSRVDIGGERRRAARPACAAGPGAGRSSPCSRRSRGRPGRAGWRRSRGARPRPAPASVWPGRPLSRCSVGTKLRTYSASFVAHGLDRHTRSTRPVAIALDGMLA